MTQVTIERELLERAIEALRLYVPEYSRQFSDLSDDLRAALQAAPAQPIGFAVMESPIQPVNQEILGVLKGAANYIDHLGGVSTPYRQAIAQAQAQPEQVDMNEQGTNPVVSQIQQELIDNPAQGLTDGEPERLYEAIKECMLHHRLQTFIGDDGENYPLVDHLSHGDSIADGQHEIDLLCDSIYNYVLKPAIQKGQQS